MADNRRVQLVLELLKSRGFVSPEMGSLESLLKTSLDTAEDIRNIPTEQEQAAQEAGYKPGTPEWDKAVYGTMTWSQMPGIAPTTTYEAGQKFGLTESKWGTFGRAAGAEVAGAIPKAILNVQDLLTGDTQAQAFQNSVDEMFGLENRVDRFPISEGAKALGKFVGMLPSFAMASLAVGRTIGATAAMRTLGMKSPTLARFFMSAFEGGAQELFTDVPSWEGAFGFAALDWAVRNRRFAVAVSETLQTKRARTLGMLTKYYDTKDMRWFREAEIAALAGAKPLPEDFISNLVKTLSRTTDVSEEDWAKTLSRPAFINMWDNALKTAVIAVNKSKAAHTTMVTLSSGTTLTLDSRKATLELFDRLLVGDETITQIVGPKGMIDSLNRMMTAQTPDEVRALFRLSGVKSAETPEEAAKLGPKGLAIVFQDAKTGREFRVTADQLGRRSKEAQGTLREGIYSGRLHVASVIGASPDPTLNEQQLDQVLGSLFGRRYSTEIPGVFVDQSATPTILVRFRAPKASGEKGYVNLEVEVPLVQELDSTGKPHGPVLGFLGDVWIGGGVSQSGERQLAKGSDVLANLRAQGAEVAEIRYPNLADIQTRRSMAHQLQTMGMAPKKLGRFFPEIEGPNVLRPSRITDEEVAELPDEGGMASLQAATVLHQDPAVGISVPTLHPLVQRLISTNPRATKWVAGRLGANARFIGGNEETGVLVFARPDGSRVVVATKGEASLGFLQSEGFPHPFDTAAGQWKAVDDSVSTVVWGGQGAADAGALTPEALAIFRKEVLGKGWVLDATDDELRRGGHLAINPHGDMVLLDPHLLHKFEAPKLDAAFNVTNARHRTALSRYLQARQMGMDHNMALVAIGHKSPFRQNKELRAALEADAKAGRGFWLEESETRKFFMKFGKDPNTGAGGRQNQWMFKLLSPDETDPMVRFIDDAWQRATTMVRAKQAPDNATAFTRVLRDNGVDMAAINENYGKFLPKLNTPEDLRSPLRYFGTWRQPGKNLWEVLANVGVAAGKSRAEMDELLVRMRAFGRAGTEEERTFVMEVILPQLKLMLGRTRVGQDMFNYLQVHESRSSIFSLFDELARSGDITLDDWIVYNELFSNLPREMVEDVGLNMEFLRVGRSTPVTFMGTDDYAALRVALDNGSFIPSMVRFPKGVKGKNVGPEAWHSVQSITLTDNGYKVRFWNTTQDGAISEYLVRPEELDVAGWGNASIGRMASSSQGSVRRRIMISVGTGPRGLGHEVGHLGISMMPKPLKQQIANSVANLVAVQLARALKSGHKIGEGDLPPQIIELARSIEAGRFSTATSYEYSNPNELLAYYVGRRFMEVTGYSRVTRTVAQEAGRSARKGVRYDKKGNMHETVDIEYSTRPLGPDDSPAVDAVLFGPKEGAARRQAELRTGREQTWQDIANADPDAINPDDALAHVDELAEAGPEAPYSREQIKKMITTLQAQGWSKDEIKRWLASIGVNKIPEAKPAAAVAPPPPPPVVKVAKEALPGEQQLPRVEVYDQDAVVVATNRIAARWKYSRKVNPLDVSYATPEQRQAVETLYSYLKAYNDALYDAATPEEKTFFSLLDSIIDDAFDVRMPNQAMRMNRSRMLANSSKGKELIEESYFRTLREIWGVSEKTVENFTGHVRAARFARLATTTLAKWEDYRTTRLVSFRDLKGRPTDEIYRIHKSPPRAIEYSFSSNEEMQAFINDLRGLLPASDAWFWRSPSVEDTYRVGRMSDNGTFLGDMGVTISKQKEKYVVNIDDRFLNLMEFQSRRLPGVRIDDSALPPIRHRTPSLEPGVTAKVDTPEPASVRPVQGAVTGSPIQGPRLYAKRIEENIHGTTIFDEMALDDAERPVVTVKEGANGEPELDIPTAVEQRMRQAGMRTADIAAGFHGATTDSDALGRLTRKVHAIRQDRRGVVNVKVGGKIVQQPDVVVFNLTPSTYVDELGKTKPKTTWYMRGGEGHDARIPANYMDSSVDLDAFFRWTHGQLAEADVHSTHDISWLLEHKGGDAPMIVVRDQTAPRYQWYLASSGKLDETRDLIITTTDAFRGLDGQPSGTLKGILPKEVIDMLDLGYELRAVTGPFQKGRVADSLVAHLARQVNRLPEEFTSVLRPDHLASIRAVAAKRGWLMRLTPEGIQFVRPALSTLTLGGLESVEEVVRTARTATDLRAILSDPGIDVVLKDAKLSGAKPLIDRMAEAAQEARPMVDPANPDADQVATKALAWMKKSDTALANLSTKLAYYMAPINKLAGLLQEKTGRPIWNLYQAMHRAWNSYEARRLKYIAEEVSPLVKDLTEEEQRIITWHLDMGAHRADLPDANKAALLQFEATHKELLTAKVIERGKKIREWFDRKYDEFGVAYTDDEIPVELAYVPWRRNEYAASYAQRAARLGSRMHEDNIDPMIGTPWFEHARISDRFDPMYDDRIGGLMVRYADTAVRMQELRPISRQIRGEVDHLNSLRNAAGGFDDPNQLYAMETLRHINNMVTGNHGPTAANFYGGLYKFLSKLVGKDVANAVTSNLTSWGIHVGLGFRPGSAIRNVMFAPVPVYSLLGGRHLRRGLAEMTAKMKGGGDPEFLKYVDLEQDTFFQSYYPEIVEMMRAGKLQQRGAIGDLPEKYLKAALKMQEVTERFNRGFSFFAGVSAAKEYVAKYAANGLSDEMAQRMVNETALGVFSKAEQDYLIQALRRNPDEFIQKFADSVIRFTQFSYGPFESFRAANNKLGKLAFFFGTWTMNQVSMIGSLTRRAWTADGRLAEMSPQSLKYMARYSLGILAGWEAMKLAGLNPTSTYQWGPAGYAGSPYLQFIWDSANWARTFGHEREQFGSKARYGFFKMLTPSGAFVSDVVKGYDDYDDGLIWNAAGHVIFGTTPLDEAKAAKEGRAVHMYPSLGRRLLETEAEQAKRESSTAATRRWLEQ